MRRRTKIQATHDLKAKLLIFDTHPIQYRSPVFRDLFAQHPETKVYFFNETFNGNRWWFHEVGKIPPQKWELKLREGFNNVVIGTAGLSPIALYRKFSEILDEEKPSAVAFYGYYLPEHWALLWICRSRQIPLLFIGETFSLGRTGPRRLIKKPLLRLLYSSISQFVSIGKHTEAFYRSFGIEPNRITPAKYCTDTSFFSLNSKDSASTRRRLREENGIPENAFVILFVGRLFERKRPEDVMALHKALEHHSGLYTIVIGNGPLEAMLRESGSARLKCLGFKNQAETRDWYHAADLLFVPSEFETWGLVVNEAFAAGLPALVTETCGVAGDLVIAGETGFSYPVGEVKTAASFVEKLLTHPSERERLGKNAVKKVLAEYRTDLFAKSLWSAFQKTLSRTPT